jgi:hypothetical protein
MHTLPRTAQKSYHVDGPSVRQGQVGSGIDGGDRLHSPIPGA